MSTKIPRDKARVEEMAKLYRAGETLQQIGDKYGMTRERVRQLISFVGLNRSNGGVTVKAKRNEIINSAKRDASFIKRRGCTYSQYVFLRDVAKATRQYGMQRKNAQKRGIHWDFDLWTWWTVWADSGKWESRGRGQGKYCMARKGDAGPYSKDNVFICLCVENNSNRKEKKSGLPTGVTKKVVKNYVAFVAHKMIGGKSYHVGSFKTPEAASQAYQSFNG